MRGKDHGSAERAPEAFLNVGDFVFARFAAVMARAADRHGVWRYGDVEIFRLYTRDGGSDNDFVGRFKNVHRKLSLGFVKESVFLETGKKVVAHTRR